MARVCKRSLKRNVFGADVALVTRSAAARGDVADLERAMNGYCSCQSVSISFFPVMHTSSALRAFVCSMMCCG